MLTMSKAKRQTSKFTFFGQVFGFKAFLVIALSTVVAGFSDPNFGWNANSARLLISMWLVYLFINYGGALVRVINGVRKKKGIAPRIAARPVYLLFLLLSIVFARLTGIEPALIFGTVLALEYTAEASVTLNKYTGRATLAGALHNMILGLFSWVLYSIVATFLPAIELALATPGVGKEIQYLGYIAVSLGEFLSIMTVAALAALPLSLLPFSFLEGGHLWRWSKIAWGITYTLGLCVYALVLVSMPSSWSEISISFATWVSFYIGYFILVIGVWAYFKFAVRSTVNAQSDQM